MQQKIITMTQLALYDKHTGTSDRDANDYFRHDYIYRKNLGTRLAVGFGGFIMLALYWARYILIEGVDFFELDFSTHLTDSIFFILAILAAYSLIGTVQGTREYYLVQKRLTRYLALVRQLERINERAQRQADVQQQKEEQPEEIPPEPAPTTRYKLFGKNTDDKPSPTTRFKPVENKSDLTHTRRLKPLEPRRTLARPMTDEKEETPASPLIYKTPTQRSEPEPDGTNTDSTGNISQDL